MNTMKNKISDTTALETETLETESLPTDRLESQSLDTQIREAEANETLLAATECVPQTAAAVAVNDNATANDNARDRAQDTTALLAHPALVRYLGATLRRYGVGPEEMADAVAEVQTRSLEATRVGRMPANLAQWKALAAKIAARWAVDRLRAAKVHDKYDAGPCEDPDSYLLPTLHWEHRDPVDTARYLAILNDLFDSGQMPPDGAEVLWAEAEEVPHKEIAAELGVNENTVNLRLSRMRARFRAKLAALGMLVIAPLLFVSLRAPSIRESAEPRRPTPSAETAPRIHDPPPCDGGTSSAKNLCSPVTENQALHD